MHRNVWRALSGIAVLCFLFMAWTGVKGGIEQFSNTSPTTGQQIQSALQLAFGVLAVASVVTWFWVRRWSRPVFVAWVVSLGLAGALAPVVWAQSSPLVGVVSGVASALVAWGMVALLRFSARGGA